MTNVTEKDVYRVGRLLLMQRGEYSDKCTVGLFRVLVEFHAPSAVERYKETRPPDEDEYYNDDGAGFVKHMIETGYLEELEYDVLHTGCYGRLEVE